MKKRREPSAAGLLILQHLRERRLSQAGLARLVPLNRTLLVDIIRDRRSIPRTTVSALSQALELSEGQRDELVLADANDRIRRRQRSIAVAPDAD